MTQTSASRKKAGRPKSTSVAPAAHSKNVAAESSGGPVAATAIHSATATFSKFSRFMPWLLVVGGAIGLLCSFIIAFDEFKLYQNPHFVPSCNLNPVISCGSVMQSKQAHIFGFPNPFIGLMAFPVVIASGMAIFAGAKLKRWYWLGLEAGTIFGLALVHWLFFETVYRIHALCPYCMIVWVVTITTFWYVTLYNFEAGNIKGSMLCQRAARLARRHHLDILVLWLLIIAGLVLKHFWYYYGKYL